MELIQYMSNEISKDFASDHEYMIIANFVNYLLNVNMKTKDSDGIIYPSVPAQGNGFNVAIKPNVAPREANSRASAAPIPLEAPVIKTFIDMIHPP